MEYDFIFAKNIKVKLTYENTENDNKKHTLIFVFRRPTDKEQFALIGELDNIEQLEELSTKSKNINNKIVVGDIDKETILNTINVRNSIIDSMSKNLKSAPGFNDKETKAIEYLNLLEPFIRNDLIGIYMEKSMEGFTSSKKFRLLALDGGTTRN